MVRRVAFLVENAKDTGGNRVIFNKIASLLCDNDVKLTVVIVPRVLKSIKDVLGQIRDCISVKFKTGFNSRVRLQDGMLNFDEFDLVVSTSRRTLEVISNHSDPRHCHLFQHIEAWETLNSLQFLDFCEDIGYPNGHETLELIEKINLNADLGYISAVEKTKRFVTVSNYLKNMALTWGAPATDIEIWEPSPHIIADNSSAERKYDVLIFLRGHRFKGDELSLKLVRALCADRKIALVSHPKYESVINEMDKKQNISFFARPSDSIVQGLYASSRVVVHPSLSEGFGSIPQEALKFGCSVVASNTGWVQDGISKPNLYVIKKHVVQHYLKAIDQCLEVFEQSRR